MSDSTTWITIGLSTINLASIWYLIYIQHKLKKLHRIALAQLEEIRKDTIRTARIRTSQLPTKIVDGDPEALRERSVTTRRDSDDLPATGHMRPGLKRNWRGGDNVGDDDQLHP